MSDELLERRIEALEAMVAGQGDDKGILGALKEISDFLGIPKGESNTPYWWDGTDRAMDERLALNAWRLLQEFVNVLRHRYDRDPEGRSVLERSEGRIAQKIESCWFAHPDLIDELSALFYSWKGSLRPNADRDAMLRWQRYRREVLELSEKQGQECRKKGCWLLDNKRTAEITDKFADEWMKKWIRERQPQTTGSTSSPASQQSAT